MSLDEPSWWYRAAGDGPARWLQPIARVYAALSERRMAQPPRYRSNLPVICIGNFTAGGTGKTPLTMAIGERLRARGLSPAVLTRGYGGTRRGPAWVAPSHDTAREVGDEPLLLAQSLPVMVARDREAGARLIEAASPPHDAILMDDGLQNPALAKDLRIAVVDGRRGLGNGQVIPAGPLRARFAFQVAHADAIVVNCPPADGDPSQQLPIEAWLREQFPGPVISAHPKAREDCAWLADRPVLAFAGIANPQRFYDLLGRLGAATAATRSFADHRAYSEADARRLMGEATRLGAQLVTTEKDWVRLLGTSGALADLRAWCRVLAIRLDFEPRDEGRLTALLDGILAKAPQGDGPIVGRGGP